MTDANTIRTRCCIVGGGPAGMVLGLLLARTGVETLVLEKHGDFLRDFRGDTVHPSTLRILDDLGLMARFEALPQHRERELRMQINGCSYPFGDFTGLKPFDRSEEHTSELQSLMRISYAVFCLKKKKKKTI